jgi:hypothetical protein
MQAGQGWDGDDVAGPVFPENQYPDIPVIVGTLQLLEIGNRSVQN